MRSIRSSIVIKLFLILTVFAAFATARPGTFEDYMEGFVIGGEDRSPNEVDAKVACVLPPQRGHCRAMIVRWRYDVHSKDCKEFKFGGCGGNANNFSSKKHCLKTCKGTACNGSFDKIS